MTTLKKGIMIFMMAAVVSSCLVGCNEKENSIADNSGNQTEAGNTEDRDKESKESETMADRDNNQNDTQKNENRDETDRMGDRDGSDMPEGLDDEDKMSDDTGSLEEKERNDKFKDNGMEDGDGILGRIGDDIEDGADQIGDDLMGGNE